MARWVRNELWLNAFLMTPQNMPRYVEQISEYEPCLILAYVESIYELARHIEREGGDVYSPQAIMTTAGTLHPHMRETVERVFSAPVFDRYGSRETGDIACEDEQHDCLVVSAPTHFIEILDSDGTPTRPGEVGEVVVTLLREKAMPLIRYRIGDMAVPAAKASSHSRAWPVMKSVTGRIRDLFVTTNGSLVHGAYFTHLFFDRPWVERFQLRQNDPSDISIEIVLSGRAHGRGNELECVYALELREIESKIRHVMGPECAIRIDFVEQIARSGSGKFRYVMSDVERQR
jgi:phenylacetate-CoA ligase